MFDVFYGDLQAAPLIRECPINLECKMTHSLDLGSHSLVVGEIIETHIDEDCLKDGKPDPEKIDPLIFLPGVQRYGKLGELIAKAFQVGKERD